MPELMEGTVKVPGAGRIKKRYVMIPAGLAAAFVAYRWYQAKQEADAVDTTASGLYTSEDMSEYGLSTTGGTTTVTGNSNTSTDATSSTAIDTNAEWTQRAAEVLGNAGYDQATVYAALGEFLARRSLDTAEATIARAALGAVGQPPTGGPYSVIEAATTGTASPAAPANLRVTAKGPDHVNLAWNTVDGVAEYAVYRSDTGSMTVRAGPGSVTIYGLKPSTNYSFQVAAVGSTGKIGPKSNTVSVKTSGVTIGRPATPTVSNITRTSFRATVPAVPGVTQYRWYISGREVVGTEAPYRDFTGLKANTTYSVGVRGDSPTSAVGPMSPSRTVKTKK